MKLESSLIPQGVPRRKGITEWGEKRNPRQFKDMAAKCASFIPMPGWSLVPASVRACAASSVLVPHAGDSGGENIGLSVLAGSAIQIGWVRSLISLVKEPPPDDGFGF